MDKSVIKLYLGKCLKEFINAVLAGFMISFGAMVYLFTSAMGLKVLGCFMFATGLLLILLYGYSLVTGKLGYILENKPPYLIDCLISYIGNFVGTFLTAGLVTLTKFFDKDNAAFTNDVMATLESVVESKMNDGVLSLIILGILCGVMVFFAVNTYKKADMPLARIVTVFVTIGLFCICGFEHCVADMFYFSLYCFTHGFAKFGMLLGKLMYVTLGNIIGCMLIPAIRLARSKIRSL
ncbi:MAG: formate/nitrite transporter family protein [Bacilli bacterium]